jgi:putative transposase
MLAGRFNARYAVGPTKRRVATAHLIAVTMANTYTELQYHCIWSTKHRELLIRQEIEENVWRILASTAETHNMHVKRAGGIENHVHVLVEIPATLSVSEAMKRLKGGSSNAINKARLTGSMRFGWQDGYAAYSVSTSKIPDVVGYIANQREHHRNQTFEEEFVVFLERHGVDYDPRYLWD